MTRKGRHAGVIIAGITLVVVGAALFAFIRGMSPLEFLGSPLGFLATVRESPTIATFKAPLDGLDRPRLEHVLDAFAGAHGLGTKRSSDQMGQLLYQDDRGTNLSVAPTARTMEAQVFIDDPKLSGQAGLLAAALGTALVPLGFQPSE